MKTGSATGLQIAFLTFAALLLVVPLTQWILALHAWPPHAQSLVQKTVIFVVALAVIFGFPGVRRAAIAILAQPVPRGARAELALVIGAKLLFPFALVGGYALWHWTHGGGHALAHFASAWPSSAAEMEKAFLPPHLARVFLLGGILAPILEELVFRGFLYRAWERQWGWVAAMLLTSTLFGLYHAHFWSAFFGSIVFVCVYRRTGSLWAPIAVHAITNVSLWYPFLGRHLIPVEAVAPGDLASWRFQLGCLVVAGVAIPAYIWMARHKREPAEAFPPTRPLHGPVQG